MKKQLFTVYIEATIYAKQTIEIEAEDEVDAKIRAIDQFTNEQPEDWEVSYIDTSHVENLDEATERIVQNCNPSQTP